MATKSNRPTSPHLQIYRLPLTGLISITHRMTGVLLAVGLLGCVYVLTGIANGQSSYQNLQSLLNNGFIKLMYWGFLFALSFHLCHGVRHLIWDVGKSFSKETLTRYALIELAATVILTVIAIFTTG